uniref:Uncharacterized protein n=1 Tax=Triticum aestivum TaxID=4565 RepID=A0A3B6ERX8_WHEAT
MNQGQGETSYARNSFVQNGEQKRMKPLIETAILDLCPSTSTLLPTKMVIADLGCSSGPNAIALVLIAVEAIHNHYHQFLQPPPEVSVLLNDLPDNDFNMSIVMTGVLPGSFHERLFTSGSLHLVCSSNSLHWLSKAPEGLTMNQIPAYDIDEHTRLERRPMVLQAYAQQFRKDFTRFLELRVKEMVPGGRMVVSLAGRDSDVITPEFSPLWEFIAQILSIMVSKGVIDKAKFNSFYLPVYEPSNKELREIIQDEGSFSITEMQVNNPFVGLDSALVVPSRFASVTKAIFEPIIVHHFGEVMDEFVRTLERRWILEGSLQVDLAKSPRPMLAVSLKKA